ncbi:ABC transporter ATP-binding protein [Rhizobium rhizogenes]|uniref:ABC transporter ATP-binding protein n=1 Tax=Rhizobium rhizogenes NBRC 13257 TaxID=1220581 RepID=A0AA87QJ86_RHIRH|nr:ABC transporter ATP-binding protein [Rhizobium rhizogenes]NTG68855.1 ABC transporter ATP-binding protein [Rhizobium rhizogenes]NTH53034.1 ABC transporter ATP-binding protein [Rhizobium rhizogenes]NTH72618.1 ABC transporter ATP-binding protein [Rhizobium rhizogenes]NTI69663.1 ABC transporter ATP-binding protein [Rhizobium rhizogenes]TRB04558.1 ABC transporter ATP-binding protein [Rhizobium rhizogenes]
MATITLKKVTLDYPIYDLNDKSLKRLLLSAAGGSTEKTAVIRALHEIDFEVKAGERIGLYGPNGSGKTTLLRTIAGIFPISGGNISVTGQMTPLLGLAIGANMEISAEDNIKLLLRVDGIKPTKELVDSIWEFTDLDEKMRRMPLRTFSSGMLMRVLFSVSTAFSPEILLLDEWLSVVDETFSKKAERRMEDLVSRSKILIIASHNMKMLERVCTRIVRLEQGHIKSDEAVVPARKLDGVETPATAAS